MNIFKILLRNSPNVAKTENKPSTVVSIIFSISVSATFPLFMAENKTNEKRTRQLKEINESKCYQNKISILYPDYEE